jgi:hypothetical protein
VLQLDGRKGRIGLRGPSGPQVRLCGEEWARLTIAAHGTHLAVWVDGYQTIDQIIPEGSKGSVSLIGQDADFRNIRLTELVGSEKNPAEP